MASLGGKQVGAISPQPNTDIGIARIAVVQAPQGAVFALTPELLIRTEFRAGQGLASYSFSCDEAGS
jgi:hypothetical protein